jgi:two-component system, NtrC family, sensor kinase
MPAQDSPDQTVPARAELERLRAQLAESEKMASLGRLIAGIIHEINTPIGSIRSNNEVISRALEQLDGLLPAATAEERARRLIETCRSLAAVDKIACDRISSVIRGLKTFAREDSSDLRRADINELLRNTLMLAQCECGRRVKVETHLGDIPEVECYPHMLNQVFLNVLVNAAQAIEGEGKIVVSTSRAPSGVLVSIADSGRGIPPESRARIFSPGYSTKPVGVGTGLGLSISKQIVEERHGGSIDFESEPGRGTTFHICIPVEHVRKAAQ